MTTATKQTWLQTKTPSQLLAIVYALWLPFAGIVSIVGNPSFTVGDDIHGKNVLNQYVNGWHGVFHLVPGLIAVFVLRSPRKAQVFTIWFGLYSLLGALWGFAAGDNILGIIAVNNVGSAVHAVEAGLAFGMYFLSRKRQFIS